MTDTPDSDLEEFREKMREQSDDWISFQAYKDYRAALSALRHLVEEDVPEEEMVDEIELILDRKEGEDIDNGFMALSEDMSVERYPSHHHDGDLIKIKSSTVTVILLVVYDGVFIDTFEIRHCPQCTDLTRMTWGQEWVPLSGIDTRWDVEDWPQEYRFVFGECPTKTEE